MKKKSVKISLKKTTVASVNLRKMNEIKGGSSLPTDFDDITFLRDCQSESH